MSFQPVVPFAGYAGWRFLQRTLVVQQETFANTPQVSRATDYFKANIGSVSSAADLVKDRQLLQVALGAFGLDEDIYNRFFIEKILREGTSSPDALANKLSDKRYARLASVFGLDGSALPPALRPTLGPQIADQYDRKQFEIAVGQQDNNMRSALNLDSGLQNVLGAARSNNARWFSIMGDPPLRAVFEQALGLPSSLARIDLDQQLDTFKSRARTVFGTDDVSQLADSDRQEDVIRLFLVRAEAAQSAQTTSASLALTLIQSIPRRSSLPRFF
ncbi:flagellar protein [Loktanella sp. 3ANDIMAR09]|uniref:DUF1217 domain-containing protein n=1 Tax=Loktanella sp. 3ANDIMAR09 TaxID=1225657 RepID=UPI000700FDA9|nr:DUF1217 domain-containing protein [Loktanella sp. 3ANDIMAR09]KQI69933.1 flagellar protein [Loktanella sp. 3ANDIMAR09]